MKKRSAGNLAHLLCAIACSGVGLFLAGGIEDSPDEAETGHDAQLKGAVAAGLAQLKLHPMPPLSAPPPLPAYPAAGNVPGARFGTKPKDKIGGGKLNCAEQFRAMAFAQLTLDHTHGVPVEGDHHGCLG